MEGEKGNQSMCKRGGKGEWRGGCDDGQILSEDLRIRVLWTLEGELGAAFGELGSRWMTGLDTGIRRI